MAVTFQIKTSLLLNFAFTYTKISFNIGYAWQHNLKLPFLTHESQSSTQMISLRLLIFCVMISITLIPIFSLSIWTNKIIKEQVYDSVNEKHLLIANNITFALNRYTKDLSSALKTSASSHNTNKNKHITDDLLKQLNIHTLGKYNKSGKRVITYFGDTIYTPNSLFSLKIDVQLLEVDKVYFSDLKQGFLPEPSLFLYLKDDQEQLWLAVLSRKYIKQIQSLISFGEKGHAAIVDKKGRILAHPREDWENTGKNLSKVSIVKQMMAGETGVSQFYSPALEEDMIAGFNVIDQTGWGVMVPQPISELDISIGKIKQITLTISLISFFTAALLSWWVAGIITHPIKTLARRTNRIAGSYDHKLNDRKSRLPPTKEFSALMLSFNHMAKQIEKDKLELSKKVYERTIELKESEAKSRNLANLDFITGLASRMSAINTLEQLTEKKADFALRFIDLDNFKPINDKFGHITGDRLLQAVARRIRSENDHKNNLAARYGGDEFLIIINKPGDLDSLMAEVNEILALLTTPYIIDGLELHIGACIGITRNNRGQNTNADQLIHQADQAMYQAKAKGKNRAILYSSLLEHQNEALKKA